MHSKPSIVSFKCILVLKLAAFAAIFLSSGELDEEGQAQPLQG